MDVQSFQTIVLESKNSSLLTSVFLIVLCIFGMIFLELFLRKFLKCNYFSLGKIRIAPALLMLIPLACILIYMAVDISNYDADLSGNTYVEYIGQCRYESETVTLENTGEKIYVGKGHIFVPQGESYGRCIYSEHAKVIVFFEPLDPPLID